LKNKLTRSCRIVASGFLILGQNQTMSSTIKTFLVQLVIFLVVGEILSRLFIPSILTAEHLHFNTTEKDAELGWKTIANHQFKDTINDAAGVEYTIDYQTYKDGFRSELPLEGLTFSQAVNSSSVPNKIQGLTESQTLMRPKVLFIGDSYTQAVEVGNGKTFYHLLEKKLPIQVYAYGASGFSSLQQLMILEKYVDKIKPDLVVWQFCSNDFIDNYHELEMEAQYKIGVRRPYVTLNGNKTYITPIPTLIQWSKYSRLVYAIYILKEKVKGKFFPDEKKALFPSRCL